MPFQSADGTSIAVDIWYSGGRLCRIEYADDGTPVLVPLLRVGNPVRRNANGTHRTYVEYAVPHPGGEKAKLIREPTFRQDKDTFNHREGRRDRNFAALVANAAIVNRAHAGYRALASAMSERARHHDT